MSQAFEMMFEQEPEVFIPKLKEAMFRVSHTDINDIHAQVDKEFADYLPNKPADHKPTCAKGCNFCCYLHVDISEREAALLAPHVTPEREAQLKSQAGVNLSDWQSLPYKSRKCAFLENGECSVYEQRPSSCRKYYVATDPKLCYSEHEDNIVGITFAPNAEVIHTALLVSDGCGNMADMILKHTIINKIKNL